MCKLLKKRLLSKKNYPAVFFFSFFFFNFFLKIFLISGKVTFEKKKSVDIIFIFSIFFKIFKKKSKKRLFSFTSPYLISRWIAALVCENYVYTDHIFPTTFSPPS